MADTYNTQTVERQPAYQDLFSIEDGHLQEQEVYGVKTEYWDISMEAGMTLEKLQADHEDGYIWQLPEEGLRAMRHNTRVQDRINAKDEDYEGSYRKGLFLAADVVASWNDSKVGFDIDVDQLVASHQTQNRRTNWTLKPNTPVQYLEMNIFDPNNFFSRRMYEKQQMYNMKTLNDDIKLEYDRNKQWVAMPTSGVGWERVLKNQYNPALKAEMAIIREKNQTYFKYPTADHVALVPYDLGEAIYEKLAEPLQEVEASYTDFSKLRSKILRSDGEKWNSTKGLVGDSKSYGKDSVGVEVKHNLHKPISAGMTLRVKFVLED